MSVTELPAWLTYPGSRVSLRFRANDGADGEIGVVCNAQGLGSVVAALLWLTSFSDHGALSLSALPFVEAEGPLALSVVIAETDQPFEGELVRVDKDRQFEWQIHEDQLTALAVSLHRVATSPEYVDYYDVNVSPSSSARLRFEVMDEEASGRFAT